MSFQSPVWLLLAVPVGTLLVLRPLPGRWLCGLRAAVLVLALLAMAGLAVQLPDQAGTAVVVADRSQSMPPGSDTSAREAIHALQAAMGPEHRLAVVSFGQRPAVEQPPQHGPFSGFAAEVGGSGSDLASALEQALSLIPRGEPGRILVISDGLATGKDPQQAALQAAARGIGIDVRPLQRDGAGDLAVASLEAPAAVAPGQAFYLTAWISAPTQQEVHFELRRGSQVLASGTKRVPSGLSRLSFRDSATEPGALQYTLRLAGAPGDPVPENDTARVLLGVEGPKPVLCISGVPGSGLARLLQAGGLDVRTVAPEAVSFDLETLAGFSAVLLENVPAERIGKAGLESLASWVREAGAGLMMTGGKGSYGQGGYFRSPLEPILPVSMELRQEHRKLAVAIVVAMDRSGSMAAEVGGGRTKMDLANLAAVQVLDLLGPMDQLGVLAVDSAAHVVAPLGPLAEKAPLRSKILRIESMGGGIYVFEALAKAVSMLLPSESPARHILLLADAADAEEPGAYELLLEECRERGMTVSVVGLGTPADVDAKLLEDVASRGGGRIFYTEDAHELPRLFAQDTFLVARSTFLEDPVEVSPAAGLLALTGRPFEAPPPAGGYNLCYLRPEASLAVVTKDEYQAPFVAAWQAGAGRVLAYTGEADGAYTGAMSGWREHGAFLGSLVRWTAGAASSLPGTMSLTQQRLEGGVRLELQLDPEAAPGLIQGLPRVTTLRQAPGRAPEAASSVLTWTSPSTLSVELPLEGQETAVSSVEVPGHGRITLPPVCLPYSPEHRPAGEDEGLARLEALAEATGGVHRIEIPGLWKDLPLRPRAVPLAPGLLLAAALLLLLEVFERRTGWLSRGRRARPEPARAAPSAEAGKEPVAQVPGSQGAEPTRQEPVVEAPKAQAPSVLGAMQAARQKAQRRTERRPSSPDERKPG